MEKQRNALRTGVFMIVSLALALFVVVAISGAGRFTQKFDTYPVAFPLTDDIGGLRIGDDVRIGGMKVGAVRDIDIRTVKWDGQPAQPEVVVYVDLPDRYHLTSDADVVIERGLTGAAAINIESFGSPSAPALASGEYLHGNPDRLAALMQKLDELQPDLKQTVANLRVASGKLNTDLDKLGTTADSFTETGMTATETVQSLRVQLPGIIAHFHEVAAAAVAMLGKVRDFVGPASGDFHQTVANLAQATGEIRQRLPGLLDRTQTALDHVNVALGRAADAMTKVQATAANARDATGALRSLLLDNKSRLQNMIDNLKSTSDNLKYASIEIRHSPWRLLYQPKPDEMANLNLYDSVRQFAEGADSLNDAADALRDAVADKTTDPEQVKRLMAHLDDSFARFQQVEQKLWSDIKQ